MINNKFKKTMIIIYHFLIIWGIFLLIYDFDIFTIICIIINILILIYIEKNW